MKNYEIYPNTYFMSHNLTPFCRVVSVHRSFIADTFINLPTQRSRLNCKIKSQGQSLPIQNQFKTSSSKH